MKITKYHRINLLIFIGGIFFVLDQILKWFARNNKTTVKHLIDNILGWEFFANPGIAFGIPVPDLIIITITPLILLFLLIHYFETKISHPLYLSGIVLVVSGALSNLVDRILFGITIDYFRIFNSIINVADIAIVLGALFVVIYEWGIKKQKVKK